MAEKTAGAVRARDEVREGAPRIEALKSSWIVHALSADGKPLRFECATEAMAKSFATSLARAAAPRRPR